MHTRMPFYFWPPSLHCHRNINKLTLDGKKPKKKSTLQYLRELFAQLIIPVIYWYICMNSLGFNWISALA